MKRLLFVFAFISCSFLSQTSAQLQFGAGVDLWLEGNTAIGVQGKVLYGFTDQIRGNSSFTYYLGDFPTWSLDIGAQYDLIDGETFKLAPLVGIDMTNIDLGFISSTSTNLQVGVFMEIPLSGMNLYVEPKLILGNGSGLVVSAGVLF